MSIKSRSTTVAEEKSSTTKEKWLLNGAAAYFEVSNAFTGKISSEKLSAILNSEELTTISECLGGKSLKVNFTSPEDGEVRFLGFITAQDYSIELTQDDIPELLESIVSIKKARSEDEILAMY